MAEWGNEVEHAFNEAKFEELFGLHALPLSDEVWAEIRGPDGGDNRRRLCASGQCDREYMPAINKFVCFHCLYAADEQPAVTADTAGPSNQATVTAHPPSGSVERPVQSPDEPTGQAHLQSPVSGHAGGTGGSANEGMLAPISPPIKSPTHTSYYVETDDEFGDPEEDPFQLAKKTKLTVGSRGSNDEDSDSGDEVDDEGSEEDVSVAADEDQFGGFGDHGSDNSDSGNSMGSVKSDTIISFYK